MTPLASKSGDFERMSRRCDAKRGHEWEDENERREIQLLLSQSND